MSLNYDELAPIYDELYGDEQRAKYDVILEIVKVDASSVVLDVGCGTALLSERLKNSYYIGLDRSRGMLRVAKRRVTRYLSDLVCGDAERMPLRSEAFTYVFSITVVHEAPGLVREALRVLRTGGILAISLLKKKRELLSSLLHQLESPLVLDVEYVKDVAIISYKRAVARVL